MPAKVLYCLSHTPTPFSQALQWFTTGCPMSRGEHLSQHKKPFPICAWCKECLSYLQSHQELTNSLREERDETPQPSFCLIYNPFMTKKEYCIHKTQEVVQGKLPSRSALISDTVCEHKWILMETDVGWHYADFLHAPGDQERFIFWSHCQRS